MNAKLRESYILEVQYQNEMLKNLQRWLKNSIVFSSFTILMIYFGSSFHPLIKTVGIILTVICVVAAIAIGLALKNGRANLHKILNKLEK